MSTEHGPQSQDVPEDWPQSGTGEKWLDSPDVAALYGQTPA